MGTTKLDWTYQNDSGEYHAEYKGIVIRAILDQSPGNPFTEGDYHWPMLALPRDRIVPTSYDDSMPGVSLDYAIERFTDAQLVHDQIHIAKLFDTTVPNLIECYGSPDDAVTKYCRSGGVLRDVFASELADWSGSKRLEKLAELYKLLNIPCLHTTVHGYSQGDQTDLLIVATPEAQEKLRSKPAEMSDEEWVETLAKDMEGQAKLYKSWAFGDVYGYQLARRVPAPAENDETGHCVECGRDNSGHEGEPCLWDGQVSGDNCPMYDNGENTTLEDIEEIDAACWGFYGTEFDESGLEEAAMDAAEGYVKERADAAV